MTFFCPMCWKEIKYDDKRCPTCAVDITEYEKKSFVEKLINALRHPERETVQRAVLILGKLKSIKAVKPLVILFELTSNPYLKIEILDFLNIIKTPDAVNVIVKALDSIESIVRRKAKELIERREYISEEK
jgi:HEAT repeat protein